MEITKTEVSSIGKTFTKAEEMQLHELNELQLSLVGGGIGDVVVN